MENTIIIFVCPPKFCITIVSSFSWDLQWSQEKTKTMLIQNLRRQTKSIMVFSEVGYLASIMAEIEPYSFEPMRDSWESEEDDVH